MRRFKLLPTAFAPAVNANISAKREMGIDTGDVKFILCLVLSAGLTGTAGLLFGAYKIGRYVEKSSRIKGVPFCPEENPTVNPKLEERDLIGFRPINPNNLRDAHKAAVPEKAEQSKNFLDRKLKVCLPESTEGLCTDSGQYFPPA